MKEKSSEFSIKIKSIIENYSMYIFLAVIAIVFQVLTNETFKYYKYYITKQLYFDFSHRYDDIDRVGSH